MDHAKIDMDEINRCLIDLSLLDYGYEQWKLGACSGVEFRCWNRDEANKYRKYVDLKYPEFPVKFIWMEFENE